MTTATTPEGPATPGLEAAHAGLPALASRYVDPADLPWQKVCDGVDMKVLLREADGGASTALFRWQPGASLPEHIHTGIEQTWVLEGSLADHDGECKAGQFVWRPPGSRHRAYAPRGALLLAMLRTPNQFLDDDGNPV